MKIVDEPADRVVAELRRQEIEAVREPYDPRSRNLVRDFVGFLRRPAPGTRVTLFEDDLGRVRYYTVERPDPEVAALKEQVAELTRPDAEAPPAVALARIERRLEALDRLETKVAQVDALAARVERLPELERRIDRVDVLEARVGKVEALGAKVERVEALEAKVERVDALEARVDKLPALEARVGEITQLKTRLDRLER